ncbi:alpha/beta fold hydrolase [Paenibacillus filicis]|uniref:Alpha/beta fold hydrolase n=1 Tax=Paenibacillus filicis TaxID=669464 RepID=A0ABU9DG22_9BACL
MTAGAMKLFCLPYAGASAAIYGRWRKRLLPVADVHPLELAGRGARMNEPLPDRVEDAVDDLFQRIEPYLDGSPYALFGHSMGSLLAFELVHRIQQAALPGPDPVIVSGRSAPHVPAGNRYVHLMSDSEFRQELLSIGGTPQELFDTPSVYPMFERIIRSDYRMLETYRYAEKTEGIRANLIVLGGTEDSTIQGPLEEWRRHAAAGYRIIRFRGGHFFIHEDEAEVVELLKKELGFRMLKGAGTS